MAKVRDEGNPEGSRPTGKFFTKKQGSYLPEVIKNKSIGTGVLVFVLSGLLGVHFIFASHAATFATSSEAEIGTVSGNAAVTTDGTASNGHAVEFGSVGSSCPAGQAQANDGSCVPIPSGDTKLIFDDEFNGSSVDTNLWDVMSVHGESGNGEVECYMPENTTESGGFLNELIESRSVTCPGDIDSGQLGNPISSNVASGAIQTKSFNFEYGTIQARIKFANQWPALWMLGTNCQQPTWLTTTTCNWPDAGAREIDVAEYFGSINEQIHSDAASPSCSANVSGADTSYHVYSMTWSPGQLVFQVDGATTCILTTAVPSENMFIIINTALQNSFGTGDLPQTTSVDYVRVFQ